MGRRLTRTTPAAVLATVIAVTGAAACNSSNSTATTTANTSTTPSTTTTTSSAPEVTDGTKANVLKAMHGEAFARAAYLAYGAQARTDRQSKIATLFDRTAEVERGDHFKLEAELVGLVGNDAANLTDAISGESYETTTMYPQFVAQAKAEGDTAAAALFAEIAADEAAHRDALTKAKATLAGTGQVPAPPKVAPVDVPAGPAKSKGKTLVNLQEAMHGEAFASAKYLLYADQARSSGHEAIAVLFTTLAAIELREHWAAGAVLAGQVSGTSANLGSAATGENEEATRMYPGYAARAKAAGDVEATAMLTGIAADEARHRDAYLSARKVLQQS
jgi:rubrerythrin